MSSLSFFLLLFYFCDYFLFTLNPAYNLALFLFLLYAVVAYDCYQGTCTCDFKPHVYMSPFIIFSTAIFFSESDLVVCDTFCFFLKFYIFYFLDSKLKDNFHVSNFDIS